MIRNICIIVMILLGVFVLYALAIYFLPAAGKSIDDMTGTQIHQNLTNKIDLMLGKAKNAQDAFEEKLDNPAPNTSKKIEERMGQ